MMNWQARPRWVRWSIEIAVVVLIFLAIRAWQLQDHARGDAPVLALTSVAQTQVSLTGETPVLVHFSASWCPICRMMQSSIEALAQDHQVVTVLVQMSDQEVSDWLREHPQIQAASIVRDDTGKLLQQFGGKALPMDVVIAPNGKIATSEQGLSSTMGLRMRLWLARREIE
jgi:thiol-disulfide isomerase/thioredoxin